MEEWHNQKYEKYYPLYLALVSNVWSVHLFATEAGSRGYCSTNKIMLHVTRVFF